MATIITQDRVVLYGQPDGRGNALLPLSVDRHGMDDITKNNIPGRGVLYGRDDFGRPQSKVEFDEAPTGLLEFTITFDKLAAEDAVLDTMARENGKFGVWKFFIPAGRLNNYSNWLLNGRLDYLDQCKITGGTDGAGPAKDYSGDPVANTYTISSPKLITIRPPVISAQVTVEVEDINDITGFSDLDPNNDIPGYPGPDKLLFAACDAVGAGTANVLWSITGGSTWTAFTADPFAADEHIISVQSTFMTPTQYRLVVLRLTVDAGNPPEIAYADITVGDEASAPTWTAVDLGSTNNDPGESLFWPLFGRLYAGAGGDLFVSTNQGEAFTQIFTGANAINAFAIDSDENVWAVGASNTILREDTNNRGTFSAKVGPSGGGAFASIAIAEDGTLYAGNGTSIFKSNNAAGSTGGWSSLKDFGTNHSVVDIQCVLGSSQLLRAVINDSVGGDGDIWYSLDGGNTWVEVTDVANAGYNSAYFSEVDPNIAFAVGDDDTSTGIIHKLTN